MLLKSNICFLDVTYPGNHLKKMELSELKFPLHLLRNPEIINAENAENAKMQK